MSEFYCYLGLFGLRNFNIIGKTLLILKFLQSVYQICAELHKNVPPLFQML